MNTLDLLSWFRTNAKKLLTVIKAAIGTAKSEAISQAREYTDSKVADAIGSVGSIGGVFKGSFAAAQEFPTAKTGDFAYLQDANGNATEMWQKTASGWVFVMDIRTAIETASAILASNAEADANSTSKALTAYQAAQKITNSITALNLSTTYAQLDGDASQAFEVADAQAGTKQAVNASQFGSAITAAEAQADWEAA